MLEQALLFVADLKANNRREWFQQNKARYQGQVVEPVKQLVEQVRLHPRLHGSLFRIHRDVRFSADKSPYKTHVGIHFRHEDGKDAHAPGIYVHLEPGQCFLGAGMWKPDRAALERIRQAILHHPAGWRVVRSRIQLAGDSLKRVPRGYPADAEHGEDLKRTDFFTMQPFTKFKPQMLEEFAVEVDPLMAFLCQATGHSW